MNKQTEALNKKFIYAYLNNKTGFIEFTTMFFEEGLRGYTYIGKQEISK